MPLHVEDVSEDSQKLSAMVHEACGIYIPSRYPKLSPTTVNHLFHSPTILNVSDDLDGLISKAV